MQQLAQAVQGEEGNPRTHVLKVPAQVNANACLLGSDPCTIEWCLHLGKCACLELHFHFHSYHSGCQFISLQTADQREPTPGHFKEWSAVVALSTHKCIHTVALHTFAPTNMHEHFFGLKVAVYREHRYYTLNACTTHMYTCMSCLNRAI